MHETANTRCLCCREHVFGALPVAPVERERVGVDHTGDVNDDIGTGAKITKIVQITGKPHHAIAHRLRLAGERANPMPACDKPVENMATQKPGAAGQREDHSITM